MFDDWKEIVRQPTTATRVREKAFRGAGVNVHVRLYDPTGEPLTTPSLVAEPYGGTTTTTLYAQASWQTEARASRIAAIFAAHAAEIAAEINALDSLPDNARLVADEAIDRR